MEQNAVRLQRQVQRDLILREITQRILTFLELKRIFDVVVNEMLPYLAVDRVATYQFDQESQCHRGAFIADALHPDTESLLSISMEDACFDDALVARYIQGRHQVIDDILDIPKIEAGKLEVYPHPASITLLCRPCISTIRRMAEAKSILLSSQIDPDLAVVLLDERRLRQVLINLLSNAVKFTPKAGTVRLEVRLIRSPEMGIGQASLEHCVIDSGIASSQGLALASPS